MGLVSPPTGQALMDTPSSHGGPSLRVADSMDDAPSVTDIIKDLDEDDFLLPALEDSDIAALEALVRAAEPEQMRAPQSGLSDLMVAASNGDTIEVARLCHASLDATSLVNISDAAGGTALMYAAQGDHVGVVDELLRVPECHVNSQDHDGRTALQLAASKGHVGVMSRLLRALTDDEVEAAVCTKSDQGHTPLFAAAASGHAHAIELLLSVPHGRPAAHIAGVGHSNPLLIAALKGHAAVVSCFVHAHDQAFCDIYLAGELGPGMLVIAAILCSVAVLDELVKAPQCLKTWTDIGTTLHAAVCLRSVELLRNLLGSLQNAKPDVALCPDEDGMTPLYLAANSGAVETVRLLISRPDWSVAMLMANENGSTPLCIAAFLGRTEVVKLLVSSIHGQAALSMLDKNGLYPLHVAAINGHSKVVRFLLQASPLASKLRDLQHGYTAFVYAAACGQVKAIDEFLEFFLDPQRSEFFICQPGSIGRELGVALTMAAREGHTAVVQRLLEARQIIAGQESGYKEGQLLPPSANRVAGTDLVQEPAHSGPDNLALKPRKASSKTKGPWEGSRQGFWASLKLR